jgi:hypothetical protein
VGADAVLDDYFEGRHPMAFATSQFREAFGVAAGDDERQLVPDRRDELGAPAEGAGLPVRAGAVADDAAWAIWQANGMDAQSSMVHTEAIKLGEAYWLVEPPMNGRRYPRITCEHPRR